MTPAPVITCPWCIGFNPRDPIHKGKSHSMCEPCQVKFLAEIPTP